MRRLLALLCAAAPTSALKNVVVLGSGDPWLSLCTAKTASARGLPATCVSNNEPEALKMLWGKGFDGASPVKVVNGPDAIGEALAADGKPAPRTSADAQEVDQNALGVFSDAASGAPEGCAASSTDPACRQAAAACAGSWPTHADEPPGCLQVERERVPRRRGARGPDFRRPG